MRTSKKFCGKKSWGREYLVCNAIGRLVPRTRLQSIFRGVSYWEVELGKFEIKNRIPEMLAGVLIGRKSEPLSQ